jgi:hypothetical protein
MNLEPSSVQGRGDPPGDAVPRCPPPEVMEEVQAAAQRYEELRVGDRHLHFEPSRGRVRVEVQDSSGQVLGSIPAAAALDVAAGRPM